MAKIARDVAAYVLHLERDDYPQNGICSHFGVSVRHPRLTINLGKREGRLLITMYTRNHYSKVAGRSYHQMEGNLYQVGFPRCVHDMRATAVAHSLGAEIVDRWNGEDGHHGVSIVLSRACPDSLHAAIRNYHLMPSPFNLREQDRAGFSAFSGWLEDPAHDHQ